jgi:hypothetical protein
MGGAWQWEKMRLLCKYNATIVQYRVRIDIFSARCLLVLTEKTAQWGGVDFYASVPA